jgi:hypothetical protein
MFSGLGAEEREGLEPAFKEELIKHGVQALQDVFSETFSTRFWSDTLSGLSRGKIKKHFFDIRDVHQQSDGTLKEATAGDDDTLHVCYRAKGSFR